MITKTAIVLLTFVAFAAAANEKKGGGMAGGLRPIDVKDVPQEAITAGLQKFESFRNVLDGRSNSMFMFTKPVVAHAESQVVAGVMYHLTVVVGESTCRKGTTDFSSCSLTPQPLGKALTQCHIKVWYKAWESDKFNAQNIELSDCTATDLKFQQTTEEEYRQQFDNFLRRFHRVYSKEDGTGEYEYRFSVFLQNMKTADQLNCHELGTAKYGATKFADMTEKEFRRYVSGPLKTNGSMKQGKIPTGTPPSEFDWRAKGAVTPVKDQGECGSCWAFSVTGNMEGQWQIKKGQLISLSEQQLVDCDAVDDGCNGGNMANAYQAIIKMGGAMTESSYPYKGVQGSCNFNKSDVGVNITGYITISKDEGEMASWLAANGPISIGINAFAMQFYLGGISHPWKIFCSPEGIDHGVLIVGYGVKDGEPYWIVKNTWGANWGEEGYYLVYRGDGTCGLNQENTSSVVS